MRYAVGGLQMKAPAPIAKWLKMSIEDLKNEYYEYSKLPHKDVWIEKASIRGILSSKLEQITLLNYADQLK